MQKNRNRVTTRDPSDASPTFPISAAGVLLRPVNADVRRTGHTGPADDGEYGSVRKRKGGRER
jgi:hypothetical protein